MSAPVKLTEKRPIVREGTDLFGIGLGFSVSQNQRIAQKHDEELVFVSGDTAKGIETTLWRKELTKNTAVRIGGPALVVDSRSQQISNRLVGIGFSIERKDEEGVNNVQLSVEAKVTSKTVALAVPAAAHAADVMFSTTSVAGQALSQSLTYLLPGLSVVLAARSVRHAAETVTDPEATRPQKAFAITRAVGDVVRIFDLITGTLISVGASLGSALYAWRRKPPPVTQDLESV